MIRYIPLSEEDTGYRFAFFETVSSQFINIDGDEAWNDTADLMESFRLLGAGDALGNLPARLLALIPADIS